MLKEYVKISCKILPTYYILNIFVMCLNHKISKI